MMMQPAPATKIITKNIAELIEIKKSDGRFALIKRLPNNIVQTKVIILNEREAEEVAVFILKVGRLS